MQMRLDPSDKKVMLTEHNGRAIKWNVSTYSKIDMAGYTDNFREINRFFATRSELHQQNIFDVLLEIRQLFDEIMTFKMLQKELTRLVTKLYAFIPLEELEFYINYKATIRYPTDLKDTYGIGDMNRAKTYLKHEYRGLVLIVLAIRIMVPIWGEYMLRNYKEVGNNYKHYMALRIMYNTPLMHCDAMMRLRQYIDARLSGGKLRNNAILAGISSEELPEYILAEILVRGISTRSLDAVEHGSSIITNIYQKIERMNTEITRRFKPIEEKFHSGDKEREDRSSQLEQYKKTQLVSIGDVEMHKYFLTRYEELMLKIDPSASIEKLNRCLETVSNRQSLTIEKHNSLLTQWVIASSGVVEPRVIPELNYTEMLDLMATAQALLWHWGFEDLALIITSTITNTPEGLPATRTQASRNTMSILNDVYPYQQKIKSPSNSKNLAHLAIDEYEKSLRNKFLRPRIPVGLKEYCERRFVELRKGNVFVCPNNVLTQLTDMLAYIHHDLKELKNEQ